jgi:hypothetical protein
LIYFALAAFALSCVGLSSSQAQAPVKEQPKNEEAELKAAQQKLQRLMAELRDKEARMAEERRALEAKKAKEAKPEPQKNVIEIELDGLKIQPAQPGADPAVTALHGLLKSNDPKVAAMAKELLEALAKSKAQPNAQRGGGFEWRVVPAPDMKFGTFKPAELKFEVIPDGKSNTVLMGERNIEVVKPAAQAAATGTSSLKMSADGKTAAVVNADGSIVIYDVATGKEQMRFPGKK